MAHDCDECGQTCFCDADDTGGLPQPLTCPHFQKHQDEDDNLYDSPNAPLDDEAG